MKNLQNYRSKYVFTTHVYTFSWWFTSVKWVLVLVLSRTRGRCAAAHIRGSREPRVDPAGEAGRVQLDRGRRHTDALHWIFSLHVVAVVWLVLATHEKVMCWSRLLIFLCLWNACLGTVQAGLSVFTRRIGRCCGTFAVGNRETFLSA
jgi:hypothetical protein